MTDVLSFIAIDGIGEIVAGDDIAAIIAHATELRDGDVVVVTSKIVSKSLDLSTRRDKPDLLADQTDRVVARRTTTTIVRTHHGLTLAAAGIDSSNTSPGTLLPLPVDPDGEARSIRARLTDLTGRHIAVVISDTAGRAWRVGQTDIAIGCAGIVPVESFAGRFDSHGQPLLVTAPAVADEITGAAELASGKLGGRPVVIVRGIPSRLLTADDGPGAAALVREELDDLFGLGARDAVLAALTATDSPVRGFPRSDTNPTDIVALADVPDGLTTTVSGADVLIDAPIDLAVSAGMLAQRLTALATAHHVTLHVVVSVET